MSPQHFNICTLLNFLFLKIELDFISLLMITSACHRKICWENMYKFWSVYIKRTVSVDVGDDVLLIFLCKFCRQNNMCEIYKYNMPPLFYILYIRSLIWHYFLLTRQIARSVFIFDIFDYKTFKGRYFFPPFFYTTWIIFRS